LNWTPVVSVHWFIKARDKVVGPEGVGWDEAWVVVAGEEGERFFAHPMGNINKTSSNRSKPADIFISFPFSNPLSWVFSFIWFFMSRLSLTYRESIDDAKRNE